MPKKGGIITRKDVIEDDALKWGETYAKNLQVAIDKNTEFAKGVIELAKVYNSIKGAGDNSAYMRAKEEERLQFLKNVNAIKEQEAAEKAMAETRKRALIEAKLQLDVEAKQGAAKKRNTQLTIEERVQNEINNKIEKQAALEKLGLVGAYQKLNKERTDAKRKLMDLIASESASTAEIKKAQAEFDRLDEKVRKADKAVGDFTKNVGNYPQIGKLSANLKDLFGALGLAVGVDAFASALKDAYQTIVKFDQGVADLKSITGASGKDLEYLKKQAIEVGKSTKGGAVQVVEAYKLIASAKPELLENVDALNQVTKAALTLSKASGMELPEAATALTDAMNQFGADASKATQFIDALANGAKFGSAEIPQVTDALLKFGAVAKSSNISIEESTALIELLAEKGLKGAEAGTALRNVLLKLSAPDALPKEAVAVFDKFGISMETLKDKSIPIQQRLEALKPILADDANLVKIFGTENVVAAKNILANTERLADLTSKMGEYGTAAEQASERSNTLQSKTELLSAQYDSFILSLNNGSGVVSKFFSVFITSGENALRILTRMNSSWKELQDKAEEDNKAFAMEAFKVDDKPVDELKEMRRKLFEEANKIRAEVNKLEKEISERNPLQALNLFGKGKAVMNKELEELKGQLGQVEGAWEKTRNRIIELTKTSDEEQAEEERKSAELSEEERKKREQEELKRRAAYFKKLQKMLSDSFALEKFRLERTKELNQEIVDDETKTADERVESMYYVNQLAISLAETEAREKLTFLALEKEGLETLSKAEQDAYLKSSQTKIESLLAGKVAVEDMTKAEILIYEQYQAKKEDIDKKIAQNKQKLIDAEVAKTQKKIDSELQRQDTELNGALEAENNRFKILTEGQDNIEKEVEAHERRLFYIRQEYAKKGLQTQIEALEKLLDDESISAEKRAEVENKLSKAKMEMSNIVTEKFSGDSEKRYLSEEEAAQKIQELSLQLKDELVNLTNVIFDSRISNIDNEIQKNEDYYNRQLELAKNDQAQKDLIQAEADKKREALEAKKRKEQHKQAVFNKVMAAVQVGISTAQGIMQSYAQLGPIAGNAGAILVGIMGAVQLAAVLAAPIPKYKKGRKNGPKELAYVGDGGVHEVIERKSGRVEITPNTDTLVQLYAGDKVHSSMDEYQKAMRAANMASLASEKHRLNDYQTASVFDHSYDREMIAELKRNTKAIEKMKVGVSQKAPDLNHHLWKLNNSRWD